MVGFEAQLLLPSVFTFISGVFEETYGLHVNADLLSGPSSKFNHGSIELPSAISGLLSILVIPAPAIISKVLLSLLKFKCVFVVIVPVRDFSWYTLLRERASHRLSLHGKA